ncbi:MAG: hypothetical protein SNJ82_09245 [Gemmataceae bacterium]
MFRRVLLSASLVLIGAGCGQSRYVPVSGKVTYNGLPLAKVQVMFQPLASGSIDAGGVGSFALTNEKGEFTLEAATARPTRGALVGKHQVRIAFPPNALGGSDADADSDAANPNPGGKGRLKVLKQPIPDKYNSESTLTFDVPAGGTSTANFSLEGPPLPKGMK